MSSAHNCLFVVTLLAALCFPAMPEAVLAAEGRTPLLQEGKKTLFQRAVAHPGTRLRSGPEAGAAVTDTAVKPFTVFYIYSRQGSSVEVGVSSSAPAGWVDASSLTEWPQAMTLLFTERTGRAPVLFFRDEKSLSELCAADNIQAKVTELLAGVDAARAGDSPAASPVLAAEPSDKEGAVARSRFYLMPIQAMSQPFEVVKFLRVASIDPGSASGPDKSGNGTKKDAGPESMKTAIAFVIDTTISMKPYIDQSLNVVRAAYDAIEKDGLGDSVAFGMVAFRNSTEASPKLDYVSELVSDFRTLKDRRELEAALSKVEEAKSSSHSFDEDSFSGVKNAVDRLNWDAYHSRLLILISDAGPLAGGDRYSGTRMDPAEMQDYAKARNIWITAAHVRSPSGARDHAYAEKAYRQLTRLSDGTASYISIPAPTPAQGAQSFAKAAQTLAQSVTQVAKATVQRKAPQKPQVAPLPNESPDEQARRIGEILGYAMRLDFLGQARANQAPSLVSAWLADMDLTLLAQQKHSPSVEVAVLLTKNQLSDLQQRLKIIIDQAERTKKTDSKDFFQGILSASAQLARDPAAFSKAPGRNLQQTGALSEFLDGLPYKSDIMLLREEDWYRMSVGEQTAFINRLRSRIVRYEEYDKDRAGWESFGSPNAGDWVYRVPLSMLP